MSPHLDARAVLTRIDEFVASTTRTRSSDDRDLPALLCSLVDGAVEAVPGAGAAGILERSPRGVLSRHTTHPAIETLDRLGSDHGEGPTVAAGGHEFSAAATVTDLDEDTARRWPCWSAAAAAAGVASTLTVALPMPAGKRPTVMTFYCPRRDGFGEAGIQAAQAFAAPITVTLQAIDRTQSLERAVESRDLIGQAKGMLMERHGLDADEAFSRLVRISQQNNIRLAVVAAWLVDRVAAQTMTDDGHAVPAQGEAIAPPTMVTTKTG